jgi:cyclopropane fatty-acyl-phospholipid synthase-like methyltransferase
METWDNSEESLKLLEEADNYSTRHYETSTGLETWFTLPDLKTLVGRLVNQIIQLVDGLADRLRSGIDVLDIGCGRGHAINIMAKTYPNSRFVGYDVSNEAIQAAQEEAEKIARADLKNVRFETRDITSLNESEKYDLITAFDTIHDQAQQTRVLREIFNALRKGNGSSAGSSSNTGGIFLIQDIAASSYVHKNIDNPLAPTLYGLSTMHCMTVSLAYNGEGLGTAWGRQKAEQKLKESGFSERIDIKEVAGDILNYYYIALKTT